MPNLQISPKLLNELISKFDTLTPQQQKDVNDVLVYRDEHPLEFYEPLSNIKAFHESKKMVRCLWGGNSSGKTFAGEREALIYLTQDENPFTHVKIPKNARGRITHFDFSMMTKELIPRMKAQIPRSLWIEHEWSRTYNDDAHLLTLKNGKTCDFLTYDQDVEKHESVSLDWQWADETIPEKYYDAALSRLLRTGGRFWITVTPLSKMGWAVQRLYENTDLKDLVDNFFIDLDGNYTLTKEQIENFKRTVNPEEYEARIHGIFLQMGGCIYKDFIRGVHTIKDYKLAPDSYSIMTIDPHPSKPYAILWTEVLSDGTHIVYDEIWKADMTIQDAAREIKAHELKWNRQPVYRIIDKNAITRINYAELAFNVQLELSRSGIHTLLSNDDKTAGYSRVHEYLKYNRNSPVSPVNRPRLFICEDNCPKTTYQMFHIAWKDDGKETEEHKDFPDCIRYTLMADFGKPDPEKWKKFDKELSQLRLNQVESA
jgi:phage terminase large subunit-like protein